MKNPLVILVGLVFLCIFVPVVVSTTLYDDVESSNQNDEINIEKQN